MLPDRPAAPAAAAAAVVVVGHHAGVSRQRCRVPPAPPALIHMGGEIRSPRLLARQHRHPFQVRTMTEARIRSLPMPGTNYGRGASSPAVAGISEALGGAPDKP